MIRILLPLAIVAVMYFGPLVSVEQTSDAFGTQTASTTGSHFIGDTISCLTALQPPIGEDCYYGGEFYGNEMVGLFMSYSALLAIVASALAIIGLLPFIGRLTSIVTLLAGLGAIGAMGYMTMVLLGTDDGLSALGLGAYVTAAFGLLTVISGLGGMRGR